MCFAPACFSDPLVDSSSFCIHSSSSVARASGDRRPRGPRRGRCGALRGPPLNTVMLFYESVDEFICIQTPDPNTKESDIERLQVTARCSEWKQGFYLNAWILVFGGAQPLSPSLPPINTFRTTRMLIVHSRNTVLETMTLTLTLPEPSPRFDSDPTLTLTLILPNKPSSEQKIETNFSR